MKTKPTTFGFALILWALVCTASFAQAPPQPYGVLPMTRQLRWHEMEMYGLIHFGLNTYQDKEWGYGDAFSEKADTLFSPTTLTK